MRKPIAVLSISTSLFIFACGNNSNEQPKTARSTARMAMDSTERDSEKTFEVSLMDNKKDPTCGMPTTAGVSDTAHYLNKVVGFCSSECKAEFLKNPKATIAAAELKLNK